MIGQTKFISYLNSWTTPPQFIILQGDVGSGRSTAIDLITSKFKFNKILCGCSVEEVRDIVILANEISEPTFFIFYNGDKLSISAKNALLKVVEDVPSNAYFIIRFGRGTIDTLKNRAFYYSMMPYTYDELRTYFRTLGKEELFDKYGKITKNIGQIKKFFELPYEEIIDYCETIVIMISRVAQGNIFNITNKLNISGEDNSKWDITIFLNILEFALYNKYIKTNSDKYFQAIYKIGLVRNMLSINGVNKQSVFDNFFLGLKGML